jgi:autotransporter strand-loop-strand O-heptosyltransferase
MKILQVKLSTMPIPPNGWGAVEKIIWEYTQALRILGHECRFEYINEANLDEYDIIHCHAWNHAKELAEKGYRVFLSHHDHHSYVYGNQSENYAYNIQAMQVAECSFVHGQFLVEYFQNVPKYLSHGVNTDFFYPKGIKSLNGNPKLLCVGHNGLLGTVNVFDRKGFKFAIQSAEKLGYEITIVGASPNNKKYFEENPDLLLYDKLKVVYDATENELRQLYLDHDILIHASMVEAGHPPLTPLEAMAVGLPVIGTYMGSDVPQYVVERDVDEIVEAIKIVASDYASYSEKAMQTAQKYDWLNVVKEQLLPEYEKFLNPKNMGSVAKNMYEITRKKIVDNKINVHFIDGATCEIIGNKKSSYLVKFFNSENNDLIHQSNISNSMWTKCNHSYFLNYRIEVWENDNLIFQERINLKDQRVYIAIESKALGDTLAWIPYCEEFRIKHNCKLIVSCWNRDIFESEYPEIEFIDAGVPVPNIKALYRVGWYYEENGSFNKMRHKNDFREYPLQQTASDILGIEFREIMPKLDPNIPAMKWDKKYVCIAPHASASSKYWHHPEGWKTIINYLIEKGYDVINISQESANDDWHNSKLPEGTLNSVINTNNNYSLKDRIQQLRGAEFFIGLGSGLSWLAWSCKIPVVLISGFSKKYTEFENSYRILNENVCHGCFNEFRLDAGNWNWCPKCEFTDRQFECTKHITPDQVLQIIKPLLE